MSFCTDTMEIWIFLGKILNVFKIVIPILPGRNNAVLVEAAAMNQKLKYLGLDGAKTLTEKIGKITRGEK